MIRIGICDDREEEIQKLQEYAEWLMEEYTEFQLHVDAFSSPYDLLQAASDRGGYDLYLLDIIMPHMTGIDLARILKERGEAAEILFLTVSREYAVEAFEVNASGYLIKPVKKADFKREVLRCINNLAPKENPAILLKTSEGIRKICIKELILIESFNHKRRCTLSDGTELETTATLSSLYEKLKKYPCFFLPHRAYIINLEHVNGLTSTELILTGGRRVPVSRNLYSKLKKAYLDYTF